jgi:hypothetical protein
MFFSIQYIFMVWGDNIVIDHQFPRFQDQIAIGSPVNKAMGIESWDKPLSAML